MQKDNQISEQVSVSDKGGILMSLVKDSSVSKLCLKAIKISKAVSLVTAHIEDNKELKAKLRHVVLDMSDSAVSFLIHGESANVKDKNKVLALGVNLLNFIEIAQSLTLISQTNSSILIEQVKSFLNDFNRVGLTHTVPQVVIEDDYFAEEEEAAPVTENVLEEKVETKEEVVVPKPAKPFIEKLSVANPKAHAETRVTRSSFHPTSAEFRQRLATAKTIEDLHGLTPKAPVQQQSPVSSGVKNDRQELIISTIGQKGELSIKDLEGVIKGCSEKTIQRELLSLVEQGVLVKTGERRWSRYALAHA